MGRKRRTVLFQGSYRLPEEIAELTGHKLVTIMGRIKSIGAVRHFDFTDLLNRPLNGSNKYYYGGKLFSVTEIADKANRSPSFIYEAIQTLRKRGLASAEIDLFLYINAFQCRKINVYEFKGERYSATKLAKRVNIPAEILKKMRRKGYSVEETIRLEKGR